MVHSARALIRTGICPATIPGSVWEGSAVLVDESRMQGSHQGRGDGLAARHKPTPAGVYLVRLDAAPYHGTGKLLFLK